MLGRDGIETSMPVHARAAIIRSTSAPSFARCAGVRIFATASMVSDRRWLVASMSWSCSKRTFAIADSSIVPAVSSVFSWLQLS